MEGSASSRARAWWVAAAASAAAVAVAARAGVTPQPRTGEPLPGLTPDQLERFLTGKASFERDFDAEEGLGPVYNQPACGTCHNFPLGGPGAATVTRAGRLDGKTFDPLEKLGGSLFQQLSIAEGCRESVPPEATIVELRVTNGMFGFGLVQAIPDADILYHASNPPDPGVSGRAHMVEPLEAPGTLRVGRFGWKAQTATVMTFNAEAALGEMGLTSPLLPVENDPNGIRPPDLGAPDFCDVVPDPEVDLRFLQELDDFQRFLAGPPQAPRSGMTGEALFHAIGCADCHIAEWTTADDPALEEAIRARVIRPYSDFLLHDMGDAGSFVVQGADAPGEVRTPPLWGLLHRDPLWHDGRFTGSFAARVTAAIGAHDGGPASEGRYSAAAFAALGAAPQSQVVAFLGSLGRREFDHDGNNHVDIVDFRVFAGCFGGGPYTPDDPCAVSDIDRDGDVDWDDFDPFLSVYASPLHDCNRSGVPDLVEILDGSSRDADGNGVPDECECPADLDRSGAVGIGDLLRLLAAWGRNPGHPADLDGDGTVGPFDLPLLLESWGPC